MDFPSTISEADRIDVSRILIERTDAASAKARVSTIQAANYILQNWMTTLPGAGEQVCDVRIIFEDGMQYRSQLDLTRSRRRICLARHIRHELAVIAANPKNMKGGEAKGDAFILGRRGADMVRSAQLLLDRYNI